jgi:uncharacterized protein
LVNFQWQDADSNGAWSIVKYDHFLNEKDVVRREILKKEILMYNKDDVKATLRLEEWLRSDELNKN